MTREHSNDLARARRLAREPAYGIELATDAADAAYLATIAMRERSTAVAKQCGWERGDVSRAITNAHDAASTLVVALIELEASIERRTR